jgi:hypothetical protein
MNFLETRETVFESTAVEHAPEPLSWSAVYELAGNFGTRSDPLVNSQRYRCPK